MNEIGIKIRNKRAWATDHTEIVCDNSDYTVNFDFDEEWSAYETKTARFDNGVQYVDVIFAGNVCPVPALSDASEVKIGVYAGELHTTTAAHVLCRASILGGTGTPAAPAPPRWRQF